MGTLNFEIQAYLFLTVYIILFYQTQYIYVHVHLEMHIVEVI